MVAAGIETVHAPVDVIYVTEPVGVLSIYLISIMSLSGAIDGLRCVRGNGAAKR